jgi:hypothetical protein
MQASYEGGQGPEGWMDGWIKVSILFQTKDV